MAKGNRKGSSFERYICTELSLWWSDNVRDDIFWRTSGSGARAKTRSKQGKNTFGQGGDVQAIDPIGQPLIDLTSIEIKRGYKGHSIADVLDYNPNNKEPLYIDFLRQAFDDASNSGVPYWWLITKRDRKQTLLFVPEIFLNEQDCCPMCFIKTKSFQFYVVLFEQYLKYTNPNFIIKIWESICK